MVFRAFLSALCLTLFCGVGAADTALQRAVDLWLEGDDARALPMLSELAASGNSEARLLLARIETGDLGPSPYRQALSREQSRELFRQMDWAPFGRSWLAVEAAEGNELAQALLQSKRPVPNLTLVENLIEMGEPEASDYPTRIIALYGDDGMRQSLLDNDRAMQDLRPYLSYLLLEPEPRGDGIAALRHIQPDPVDVQSVPTLGMAGLLALGLGYGDVSPDNPWRPAVEDWLMTSKATRPIAGLCNAECPQETRACAFAFLALSGGYFEAIRYDSPLETVIPQDRFLDSPRARLMVLRRATLARTEANLDWLSNSAASAALSSCAMELIAKERAAYQ